MSDEKPSGKGTITGPSGAEYEVDLDLASEAVLEQIEKRQVEFTPEKKTRAKKDDEG